MENYIKRTVKVMFGLVLYSIGLLLSIQANIGLAPWDAFGIGISKLTGISYGNVSILTGIIILIVVVLKLKEKIGIGTILNTVLIGVFVDILIPLKIVPQMTNFFLGLLMLLAGQVVISFASYFYISPGLGCGPRDTLMVGLGKQFPNVPIGAIRGLIEGTVLLIGFLLGAKVGIGTIIAVFGISFILQTTFKLLHFDIKAVEHESIFETMKNLKVIFAKSNENF
ncbi:MAG: YitT family protein [Sedimentibacter sp.]